MATPSIKSTQKTTYGEGNSQSSLATDVRTVTQESPLKERSSKETRGEARSRRVNPEVVQENSSEQADPLKVRKQTGSQHSKQTSTPGKRTTTEAGAVAIQLQNEDVGAVISFTIKTRGWGGASAGSDVGDCRC